MNEDLEKKLEDLYDLINQVNNNQELDNNETYVLEGKTFMYLDPGYFENFSGPSAKKSEKVFYNAAMEGSRTRSVILMKNIIESGFLGEAEIYAIDGLAASGLRARRWLNELPAEIAERLRVTICDLNEESLDLAMKNHLKFPPIHGKGVLTPRKGDLRTAILDQGWHWVDIDPFGSPMPFLDTAIQSLAKKAVLEVSATDTAALTGSSKTALMRRYGARVRTDGLAHDSGMRVLLACIARCAAKHDRSILPILSIWDSHHLRVSIKVRKSVEISNKLEEKLGWRVANPSLEEVEASMKLGLLPKSSTDYLPMHCFLPLSYPISREDNRVSGPLWVAQIGDCEVMSRFTAEEVRKLCVKEFHPDFVFSGWDEKDFQLKERRIFRSIRYIDEESQVIDGESLILTDDLASSQKKGSPPSPNKMIKLIKEKGFKAARSHYSKPSFRTNAPWDVIIEALEETQPPI